MKEELKSISECVSKIVSNMVRNPKSMMEEVKRLISFMMNARETTPSLHRVCTSIPRRWTDWMLMTQAVYMFDLDLVQELGLDLRKERTNINPNRD